MKTATYISKLTGARLYRTDLLIKFIDQLKRFSIVAQTFLSAICTYLCAAIKLALRQADKNVCPTIVGLGSKMTAVSILIIAVCTVIPTTLHSQEFTIRASVWDDVNRDGVADAADRLQTDCRLLLCPGDVELLPDAEGRFSIVVDPSTQQLPLSMYVTNCNGWRQTVPAGNQPVVIEQPGDIDIAFLGNAASETRAFSGFRHDFFDVHPQLINDSLLRVQFIDNSQLARIELPQAEWSMQTWLDNGERELTSLRMRSIGENEACGTTEHFIAIEIVGSGSTEDVRVDFSAIGSDNYRVIAFRHGEEMHLVENVRGRAFSLPNNVHTWEFGADRITLQELCPVLIDFADGRRVEADRVVVEAVNPSEPLIMPRNIELRGDSAIVNIYRERFTDLGMNFSGSAAAILQKEDQKEGVRLSATGPESGAVQMELPHAAAEMAVQWRHGADGIEPGDNARLDISYTGFDYRALEHTIAALELQSSSGTIQCVAPAELYGDEPRLIALFRDGQLVVVRSIEGELKAEFQEWPSSSLYTTLLTEPDIILNWPEAVAMQLPTGETFDADELRITAPDFGARTKAVTSMKLSSIQFPDIDIIGGGPVIPGQVTITITGKMTSSAGPPIPGQTVLVREYPTMNDTLLITDALGDYTLDYVNTTGSPTWLSVELPPALGWLQTSPTGPAAYNVCLFESCASSTVFDNLNFILGDFNSDERFERNLESGELNNFEGSGERSMPSPELRNSLTQLDVAVAEDYDADILDGFFAHTFQILALDAPWSACEVVAVALRLQLRAGTDAHVRTYNDKIMLAQDGLPLWSDAIAKLAGGRWLPGQIANINVSVDSLFGDENRGVYLSRLYDDELDLVIGDDTEIDYALLSVMTDCAMTTSVTVKSETTMELRIQGAQPNPAGETCTLVFNVEAPGAPRIELYDAHGRKVRTIMNNRDLDVGRHVLSIALTGLPSGAYFVRFVHRGKTVSVPIRKM